MTGKKGKAQTARPRGHIEQRCENKFLVRWRAEDANGVRRQVSEIVNGDYGAALAFLSGKLNPQPDEEPSPPERTFDSYVSEEWARYVAQNWKASTMVTMGSMVKRHIIPFFSGMKLSAIKPGDVERFHAEMVGKKLGCKTRRNLHAILTKMFGYALELELIERSVVKKSLCPKVTETEKPVIDEQQVAQLLTLVPMRLKAFYAMLALTGVRCGEALGLKWQDVDVVGKELHITRAIYRGRETTPKTRASLRSRPIVEELGTALQNHKFVAHYKADSDFVFASNSGSPLNPDILRKHLQAALKQMGVALPARTDGLHLLRHSSTSIAYRRTGGDLKATQEWAGHTSSRITADIYVHAAKDQQRNTAALVGAAVFSPAEIVNPVH